MMTNPPRKLVESGARALAFWGVAILGERIAQPSACGRHNRIAVPWSSGRLTTR
jgi:hypothetical protein